MQVDEDNDVFAEADVWPRALAGCTYKDFSEAETDDRDAEPCKLKRTRTSQ